MIETEETNSEVKLPRFALSIVIPVYNGASSIAKLVCAIEELSIEGGHEIVLVEDGSSDGSLKACAGLVANARIPITLVSLARNYG
ncbi:MAG: glycosyltransferase, partial [Acetobacteraceae bacterium]|nr:glycosyltransferase [Acetobacteraceae bacterium]